MNLFEVFEENWKLKQLVAECLSDQQVTEMLMSSAEEGVTENNQGPVIHPRACPSGG